MGAVTVIRAPSDPLEPIHNHCQAKALTLAIREFLFFSRARKCETFGTSPQKVFWYEIRILVLLLWENKLGTILE